MDSGFQVLVSSLCQWNLDSGFRGQIPIVNGIPDSLSCIPDSRIPESLTRGDLCIGTRFFVSIN